ncbi:hypothetical protein BDP81DRAFT_392549 [Colletotrichum phormii]|uniref:Uncharacterized protein n=1 Tax=Colletotrichum phormii TaxID=359342 RepID=A0AAJ0EJR2_9PEZI|nr:uncharacterized protein BDP81DRAFT_392549 [Colletotrichum phormii]KAK1639205.1 hypothetical protein BDP81DRAFT_392549 [Colletotrichum phormii]
MNASVQGDRPSQDKRYTLNHTQERAVRRLLFLCALVFDALTIILVVFLCVGAWTKSGYVRELKGINNREAHLATWSTAYSRRPSDEETTVVISWHLSSCCYSQSDEDIHSGQDGCIRRAPGTPFDLESIMEDVAYAIGGYSMYSSRGGKFSALESQDIDLSKAPIITSSRTALITYIVFTSVTACLWFWHFFVGMIPDAPDCGQRPLRWTTSSGREYESVFEYHSAGISMLVVTWIASASHLLAVAAYIAAVVIGKRLQKPDQYPPESEPSDMGSMIDEHRVREVEMPTEAERDEHYRRRLEEFVRVRGQRRRAEAAPSHLDRIHEESQANHADDDSGLPSYSRVDPYAKHAPVKPNAATGPPIEMH